MLVGGSKILVVNMSDCSPLHKVPSSGLHFFSHLALEASFCIQGLTLQTSRNCGCGFTVTIQPGVWVWRDKLPGHKKHTATLSLLPFTECTSRCNLFAIFMVFNFITEMLIKIPYKSLNEHKEKDYNYSSVW